MHCVISAAIPVRLASLGRHLTKPAGIEGGGGRLQKNRASLTKNGLDPWRERRCGVAPMHSVISAAIPVRLALLEHTLQSHPESKRWTVCGSFERRCPKMARSAAGKDVGQIGGKRQSGVAAHALRYQGRDPGAARVAGAHPTKPAGIEEVGRLRKNQGGVDQERPRRAVGIHAGQIGGKNDAALQPTHCVINAAIPVRLASLERILQDHP